MSREKTLEEVRDSLQEIIDATRYMREVRGDRGFLVLQEEAEKALSLLYTLLEGDGTYEVVTG